MGLLLGMHYTEGMTLFHKKWKCIRSQKNSHLFLTVKYRYISLYNRAFWKGSATSIWLSHGDMVMHICLKKLSHNCLSSWWRHQIETFSALLAICAGNSPVPGEFPTQRRSFDVFFDLRPNKRLSKHSLGWWIETLSPPLWRHLNVVGFRLFVPRPLAKLMVYRCPETISEKN